MVFREFIISYGRCGKAGQLVPVSDGAPHEEGDGGRERVKKGTINELLTGRKRIKEKHI